jgi:CheY-like chemotaxis protein
VRLARPPSAVIVEGDRELRALLTLVVATTGVRTHAAVDGIHGLQLFRQVMPTLVVSDVAAASLDGLALCRRIRHEEPWPPTAIILFTARDRDPDIDAVLALGQVTYVAKREGVGAVIAAISRLLPQVRPSLDLDELEHLSGWRMAGLRP